jgi:hypothetical protein
MVEKHVPSVQENAMLNDGRWTAGGNTVAIRDVRVTPAEWLAPVLESVTGTMFTAVTFSTPGALRSASSTSR